jgi:PAS domain S-box-containing protein
MNGFENMELMMRKNKFTLSENTANHLFENFPQMLCSIDSNSNILHVNNAFKDFLGIKRDSVIGKSISDFIHPEDRKKIAEWGEPPEYRIRHRNGEFKWVFFSELSYGGEKNRILLVEDRSEYKEKESKLLEIEDTYREIFNSSSEAIFIHDAETGKVIDVNDTMLKMYGVTREEVLNGDASGFSANNKQYNQEKARKYLTETLAKGKVIFPWLAKKKDGELFWVEVSLIRSRIAGELRIVAFVRDLTERVKAENEIAKSNLLYQTIFNAAGDAIFLMEQGYFIDCNKTTLEIFRCSRDEIIGKTPDEFSPEYQPNGRLSAEFAREYIDKAYKEGVQRFKWRHKRLNGEEFETEVSLNRVIIDGNSYIHAIVRDMTEIYNYISELAQSEAKFFSIFKHAFFAIGIFDLGIGKLIDINDLFIDVVGIKKEKLLGMEFFELASLVPREIFSSLKNKYNLEKNKIDRIEIAYTRPDNEKRDILLSVEKFKNDSELLLIFLDDVTEQKKNQEELIKRGEFEKLIISISNRFINVPLGEIDLNIKKALREISKFLMVEAGTLFLFNEKTEKINISHLWMERGGGDRLKFLRILDLERLKWWKEHIFNKQMIVIDNPEILPEDLSPTEKKLFYSVGLKTFVNIPMVFEGKVVGVLSFDSVKHTRRWRDYELANLQILGQIFVSVIMHRGAEEALIKSEALFRSVIHNMNDIIFILDENASVKYTSPSVKQVLGYSPEDFLYKNAFEFIHPDDLELVKRDFTDVVQDENDRLPTIFRIRSKQGEWIFLEGIGSNLLEETSVGGIVITARDLTQRMKNEEKLKEAGEKYRNIFDNIYNLYVEISGDGVFQVISPSIKRITGFDGEDFIGRKFDKLVLSDLSWHEIIESMERDEILKEIDINLRSKDKGIIPGKLTIRLDSSDGSWTKAIGSIRDISENKLLEEQLRQSQKMEAVGRLAGGIAHDFNNILTAILGNADLALFSIEKDNTAFKYVEDIKNAADKASQLTRQLLAFSRSNILDTKAVGINRLISDLRPMLERLIPENIRIVFSFDSSSPKVLADKGQLEQVIINLVINASDAMPEGGEIRLITSLYKTDKPVQGHGKSLPAGTYGCIEVQDTGIGIDEDMKEIIFEPFFTTKDPSKGTGLGLSVVYRIIEQHKGVISVKSVPGKGTSFILFLPRAEESLSEKKEGKEMEFFSIDGNGRTILLIEDNPGVKRFVRDSIERYNFSVQTADIPSEALGLAEKHKGEISLIISDVVMPEMNGKELVAKLYKILGALPVIYISGYTDSLIDIDEMKERHTYFIAKPFTIEKLLREVNKALNEFK